MGNEEKNESEVVALLRAEYEKKLNEQKENYEKQIDKIKKDNIETIKTILSVGGGKLNEEDGEKSPIPNDEDEEKVITENLRKKLKIKEK